MKSKGALMKIVSFLLLPFLAVTLLAGGGLAHAWSPVPGSGLELDHYGYGGGHGGCY